MSDWNVGDLAVCVGPLDWDDNARGMFRGAIYKVSAIVPSETGPLVLLFEEGCDPSPFTGWRMECFRKIRPDEREACEPEFVTLLKRSRKTVPA